MCGSLVWFALLKAGTGEDHLGGCRLSWKRPKAESAGQRVRVNPLEGDGARAWSKRWSSRNFIIVQQHELVGESSLYFIVSIANQHPFLMAVVLKAHRTVFGLVGVMVEGRNPKKNRSLYNHKLLTSSGVPNDSRRVV